MCLYLTQVIAGSICNKGHTYQGSIRMCLSISSICRCLIPLTGTVIDFADEAQVAIFDATNSTEERREKLVSPQQQSKAALHI